MAQWSTRRNQLIFAVLDGVIEQWALTMIKLLRFFRINICYFATRFYFFLYHSGTVIQVSSKLWMFLILIFDHVTVIEVVISVVYHILSKLVHAFGLQTPITAECSMRRCHGRCRGNRIMADMSGTWDVTTQVSSKSVHW